jgi:23S rRNA pseudouridine1911/1915/1917 synthase
VKIKVDEAHAGHRLDKWLGQLDIVASRSRAAELIDRGLVRRAGTILKPSLKVQAGWEIEVELPPPTDSALKPLDHPLEILFEDSDLVVVNKPAGLVVHPAAGHAQDTLVNILLHHVGELAMGFGENRPGIVHRLDRDTSGVLVVAKNDFAHGRLAEQFRAKTAHRIYHCLVHGAPRPLRGEIRTHLGRHPRERKRFASVEGGKLAITHYQTLTTRPSFSLVSCRLETGRTHQIRVHLSELGVPILGDVIYGRQKSLDREVGRLALHARELGFAHPRDQRPMFFTKEWPPELAAFAQTRGMS